MSSFEIIHAANAIAYIGYAGSVFEELDQAPTEPLLYDNNFAVFPDEVYVILTREGHYAKIKIIDRVGHLIFQYTSQDDGSPSFVPPTATQPATWGKIKSLYR
jgi:hypothetical protein